MKLFQDDDGISTDEISKIEIDQKFARRYEHNKQREDLHRYEELKKQGLIDESYESESDSSEDEEDDLGAASRKEDIEFFENLNKVKNRDPCIYQNNKLFESESDSDDGHGDEVGSGDDEKNVERSEKEEEEEEEEKKKKKKKKPMYLKDVVAQHVIEEGPEFEEAEPSVKKRRTYNEEQEEFRKAFFDAVKDAEQESAEDDFLKVKDKKENEIIQNEDGEFEKKLGEYFGQEEELDEDKMFLRSFFMNRMWADKGNDTSVAGDDDLDEVLRDEEQVEQQEAYEENYNFRYEENAGDRVMGHSRKVEGSVRKKDSKRKEQRERKQERIKTAEQRRKEELKHLKNLKKREMEEKLRLVMEAAGIKEDDGCPLNFNDLEADFDPDEYDKKMEAAFNEDYYTVGGDSETEKPDFDREDELLGLPKDWVKVDSSDGFEAARERLKQEVEEKLKLKVQELEGNGQEMSEENKLKFVEQMKKKLEEDYYKLDYEDTIGDLKTKFKYAHVKPNRYGLTTEEIFMMDDKELNQYVSLKKLAPYKEMEWKVPNSKRYQHKMRMKELVQDKLNGQKSGKKNRSNDNSDKSTLVVDSGKVELQGSNVGIGNLSRQAKRRRRQAELKLSDSRLKAYGKMQTKAKGKGKH